MYALDPPLGGPVLTWTFRGTQLTQPARPTETDAIRALEALDAAARARVLRYAAGRWPT